MAEGRVVVLVVRQEGRRVVVVVLVVMEGRPWKTFKTHFRVVSKNKTYSEVKGPVWNVSRDLLACQATEIYSLF